MTPYHLDPHHRRSIRLPGYDYAQPGLYFVTVCAHNRDSLLGTVAAGKIQLTGYGKIAQACWQEIPQRFLHVELDEFVVMPNHIHGLIALVNNSVGARHAVPPCHRERNGVAAFGKPITDSLPTLIRSFKSASTRRVNQLQRTPGAPLWQRNYYERVVRNDDELNQIREYIADNPAKWSLDRDNPDRTGTFPLEEQLFNPVQRATPWHPFPPADSPRSVL